MIINEHTMIKIGFITSTILIKSVTINRQVFSNFLYATSADPCNYSNSNLTKQVHYSYSLIHY